MIYNVPPICKKPIIVFDGIVHGNGEVYMGNAQFTDDFKYQCANGVDPEKLVAGYVGNSGYVCIGQFNGHVQIYGSEHNFGNSENDGSKYSPWGIYINNPVRLTGKKKLTLKIAYSYFNDFAALENEAPIIVFLFKDIYSDMWKNFVDASEVPAYPAYTDGKLDFDEDVFIPEPEELIFNVTDLTGDYYIGFGVYRGESNTSGFHYYLNIGEIVAF